MNTDEKHFAIPKPAQKPYFPVMDNVSLNWLIGALAPPERRALGKIVEVADIILVNGRPFLLAQVDEETIDTISVFESEQEDLENDFCDEPGVDPEPDDPLEANGDEGDYSTQRTVEDYVIVARAQVRYALKRDQAIRSVFGVAAIETLGLPVAAKNKDFAISARAFVKGTGT